MSTRAKALQGFSILPRSPPPGNVAGFACPTGGYIVFWYDLMANALGRVGRL
jgi:hypothetical protein